MIYLTSETHRSFTLTGHHCQLNEKNKKQENHKLNLHLQQFNQLP